MRNYFTLAGVDSREYGVYISGQGTFAGPAKEYEEYEIKGRNGTLLGSNRRFPNVELVYNAFIYRDFNDNMAAFRSFLASLDGYQKLSDSYHPDEFRYAVLVDGIDPDVTPTNNAGRFEIRFACLPQRYLVSGDSAYSILTGEVTGASVYFDFSSVSVEGMTITVDQPARSRNKADFNALTYEPVEKLSLYFNGQEIWSKALPPGVMAGTFDVFRGGTVTKVLQDVPLLGWVKDENYGSRYYVPLSLSGDILACNFAYYMDASNPSQWVGTCWYENGNFFTVAPANLTDVEAFTAWLAMQNPQLVVETNTAVVWRDVQFRLPDEWGKLTTPSGTVSVFSEAQNVLTNPTPFPSNPLIRVYGTGTVTINDITVTISTVDEYVDIDCDMMDCFEGDTNRNGDVSFSSYDFPTLQPGENTINYTGSITGVEITPRWWRL